MFCGNCGTQIADGTAFCPNCGSQLNNAQQSVPVQAYQPAQQTYQQPAEQPYQQAYQQPAEQSYQQPADQAYQQPYQQAYQQPEQQTYQQQYTYQNQPGQYAGGVNPAYQKLGGWLLAIVVVNIISILYSISQVISVNSEWSQWGSTAASLGLGSYNTFFIVWSIVVVALALLQAVFVYFIISRNNIFLKYYQIMLIVNIVASIAITIYASTLPNYGSSADMVGGIIGGVVGLVLMTMYFCKSERVRTYMGSTAYQDQALFKIGV